MTAFQLRATIEEGPSVCGQIGGQPHLPRSGDWPHCRLCDTEMAAFLEIVLPEFDSSGFAPGSRLQVFACHSHDDIAGPIYSDYTPFVTARRQLRLPDEYWKITDGHYLLRVLPPSEETVASGQEVRLIPQLLTATQAGAGRSPDALQLFGEPFWIQDPESHECSCGAPMELLLQVPESYRFPMAEGAPPQPNSFSPMDYCLFLGNQLLLGARNSEP